MTSHKPLLVLLLLKIGWGHCEPPKKKKKKGEGKKIVKLLNDDDLDTRKR